MDLYLKLALSEQYYFIYSCRCVDVNLIIIDTTSRNGNRKRKYYYFTVHITDWHVIIFPPESISIFTTLPNCHLQPCRELCKYEISRRGYFYYIFHLFVLREGHTQRFGLIEGPMIINRLLLYIQGDRRR